MTVKEKRRVGGSSEGLLCNVPRKGWLAYYHSWVSSCTYKYDTSNTVQLKGTKVVPSSGEEDADGNDDQEKACEKEEKAEGLAEASQASSFPLFPSQQSGCDPFHHQV